MTKLPKAHFSYSHEGERSAAPTKVAFQNVSINADSYEWNVNGSKYNTKDLAPLKFNVPGDYRVKLTARKGNLLSPVFENMVRIVPNFVPLVKFELNYHPYPYSVNEKIQLVNRSQNSNSWEWSFGPDV